MLNVIAVSSEIEKLLLELTVMGVSMSPEDYNEASERLERLQRNRLDLVSRETVSQLLNTPIPNLETLKDSEFYVGGDNSNFLSNHWDSMKFCCKKHGFLIRKDSIVYKYTKPDSLDFFYLCIYRDENHIKAKGLLMDVLGTEYVVNPYITKDVRIRLSALMSEMVELIEDLKGVRRHEY